MATTTTTGKNGSLVVSVLRARANFGKLLNRVEEERRSLIIEKRGTPRAVLLSIRDYVKLAAPEPEILRIIGEESERNGTNTVTSGQIDQIIKATRVQKKKQ
jgi:prevent-host-death family protein